MKMSRSFAVGTSQLSLLVSCLIWPIIPCISSAPPALQTPASAYDVFDPAVYSFYFYINTNPDLMQPPIFTFEGARQHWQQYGIHEGRQASGNFHTKQYLERYPDLKQRFGNNFTAALVHFLTVGKSQGLLGYVEGGYEGRYTVARPEVQLFVSASARMSGAIDSVVWKEKEFINAWDHGRELQLAVTTLYGECFNPTEAGGNADANGEATSSQLLSVSTNGSTLATSNLPAFWMLPGQCKCDKPGCPEKGCYPMPSDPSCSAAVNTVKTSNYKMTKNVTLGLPGFPQAIRYQAGVLIPQAWSRVQVEGPTGYMTEEFDIFYTISLTTGVVTLRPSSPCSPTTACGRAYDDPPIFVTAGGTHAMGAFSKRPPEGKYVQFNFDLHNDANNTTKWTMPFVNNNVPANTWLSYEAFLCVGTLDDVAKCMVGLAKAVGAV